MLGHASGKRDMRILGSVAGQKQWIYVRIHVNVFLVHTRSILSKVSASSPDCIMWSTKEGHSLRILGFLWRRNAGCGVLIWVLGRLH